MNIIDIIRREVETDEEPSDKQATYFLDVWQHASPDQREVANHLFACACGWSVPSLLDKVKEEEEREI